MPNHDDPRDDAAQDDALPEIVPVEGDEHAYDPDPDRAGAVALGDHDPDRLDGDDDEELEGGGGGGRWLSIIGSLVVVGALFLTWYQVTRTNGFTEDTTGFQTFTKLRWLIIAGAVVTLVTTVLAQTRPLALLRVLIGAAVSLLILRRVISPPDLSTSTVASQLGIYLALLGGLAMAFGGLLDLGGDAEDDELSDAEYGDLEGPREPAGELRAGDAHDPEVVDAELVDDEHAEPSGAEHPTAVEDREGR